MNQEQVQAAFQTFDMNNDGKITLEGKCFFVNYNFGHYLHMVFYRKISLL